MGNAAINQLGGKQNASSIPVDQLGIRKADSQREACLLGGDDSPSLSMGAMPMGGLPR